MAPSTPSASVSPAATPSADATAASRVHSPSGGSHASAVAAAEPAHQPSWRASSASQPASADFPMPAGPWSNTSGRDRPAQSPLRRLRSALRAAIPCDNDSTNDRGRQHHSEAGVGGASRSQMGHPVITMAADRSPMPLTAPLGPLLFVASPRRHRA